MRVGKAPVIFIVGPTAVGKTALAIAFARRAGGEIISCDSMQVYKGMALVSQAPTLQERRTVRHHLVGILDPRREYSVASFRKSATACIASVIRRGKVPIVVGGSGLYVKALIDGLFPSPKADVKFRARMTAFAKRHGSKRLHGRLAKIDPASAAAIHPNDTRRVIRALEIHHATGRTMTELKAKTKGLAEHYDIMLYGLTAPREKIYKRIDERVDRMFTGGVVNEVRRLAKKKLSKTAAAALGVKEIRGYLTGEYDREAATSLLKMNTRRFAKRQLTWFRADKRIRWFDMTKISKKGIAGRIYGACITRNR